MLLQAVAGTFLKLIKVPTGFGNAYHRNIEVAPFNRLLFVARFFQVSAELITHGRQHLVLVVRFAAR